MSSTGSSISISVDLYLGQTVTVTYEARNFLRKPTFDNKIKVALSKGQPFIRFMEKAADTDPKMRFNFTATYYPNLGYFINKLNNVQSDRCAYWLLLKPPNIPTKKGVSSYIPVNGETLIFNFTDHWPGQGYCSGLQNGL
ncbi:hypothetical protein KUTeg_022371 [Tegillarca granosa]|uniref:DUF4430 domain-containing protein n=1 Tax=Tegillarca granosa TaxID=220873 RepID=A0ABQ9EBB2_TEGGR|nr:hypothetical protein KUTeg_022371 [Tegillarca granosa]